MYMLLNKTDTIFTFMEFSLQQEKQIKQEKETGSAGSGIAILKRVVRESLTENESKHWCEDSEAASHVNIWENNEQRSRMKQMHMTGEPERHIWRTHCKYPVRPEQRK